MIDTNEIKDRMHKCDVRELEDYIYHLCDEIDRLRGEKQTLPQDDESVLTSMCMTYRHDFGLLSPLEREPIINMLRPIYDHHVKPLLRSNPDVTPPQGQTVRIPVLAERFGNTHETEYFVMLPVPAEVEVVAKVGGE